MAFIIESIDCIIYTFWWYLHHRKIRRNLIRRPWAVVPDIVASGVRSTRSRLLIQSTYGLSPRAAVRRLSHNRDWGS